MIDDLIIILKCFAFVTTLPSLLSIYFLDSPHRSMASPKITHSGLIKVCFDKMLMVLISDGDDSKMMILFILTEGDNGVNWSGL